MPDLLEGELRAAREAAKKLVSRIDGMAAGEAWESVSLDLREIATKIKLTAGSLERLAADFELERNREYLARQMAEWILENDYWADRPMDELRSIILRSSSMIEDDPPDDPMIPEDDPDDP